MITTDLDAGRFGNMLELLYFGVHVLRRHAGHDHHKLVAAHTRDVVIFAASLAESTRHDAQYLVAFEVAKAVVDLLEAIEVADQDRQRRIQTFAAGQFTIEVQEE